MKRNYQLGGILTLIGALMGMVGHYVLFFQWYVAGMSADSAEPGCEILLKFIHPGLADLGLLGAALLAVSAYGFFSKRKWSFVLAVMGLVAALLASWFINVPFMAAGLPPIYFTMFFPYLLIYFLLLKLVEHVSWSRTLLALAFGLAYIFCFMNGVSSTSRIITIGAPIFVVVDALHWVAMAGWAVIAVAVLTVPKEWMRVTAISASVLELVVGIPLAVVTARELGRFSLFALAPITCLILLVLMVWPGLWEKWSGASE